MSEQKQARRYIISGRVQGVGYRLFAQDVAGRLNIAGWVRNRFNGQVEVFAVASPERLQAFLEKLQEGPRLSNVFHVEQTSAELPAVVPHDFLVVEDA